jgi:hypothetical protein
MKNVAVAVDYDVRGGEPIRDARLDSAPQIGRHRPVLPGGRQRVTTMRHDRPNLQRGNDMVAALEDALLLVHRRKEITVSADVLGHAEKQISARPQGEMKGRNHPLL